MKYLDFKGINPAANLPMLADGSIDEENFREHLRWLLSFDVNGLVISGHAGELESLSREERIRVVQIAREEIGDQCPLIAGVTGLSTGEAVQMAEDAKKAGADGLLVLPLPHFSFGATDKPEIIVPYFKALADAVDLPMIMFRYQEATGLMYSLNTMLAVCKAVEQVTAIKDSSFRYEEAWVAFRYFERPVSMLVAHGSLFLIRFLTCDGAVSSFSNVAPEYVIELWKAAHAGKREDAYELFKKVRTISNAIYEDAPLMQHWVVEKEVLRARGCFRTAVVRPPFQPLDQDTIDRIEKTVDASGLPKYSR